MFLSESNDIAEVESHVRKNENIYIPYCLAEQNVTRTPLKIEFL